MQFLCPSHKFPHSLALLPQQGEEAAGGQRFGLGAEECFHAPAQIGASPGAQAIAFGGHPVITQGAQHGVSVGMRRRKTLSPALENCNRLPCAGVMICSHEDWLSALRRTNRTASRRLAVRRVGSPEPGEHARRRRATDVATNASRDTATHVRGV